MNTKIIILLLLIFLIENKILQAQDTEGNEIASLENLYENGQYKETLSRLSYQEFSSKEYRLDALELKSKAFLELNEIDSFYNTVITVIKDFPSYDPYNRKVNDLFKLHYNNVEVTPLHLFGLRFGVLKPNINLLTNNILFLGGDRQSKLTNQAGYNIGISSEWYLNKNLSITLDPSYNQIKFSTVELWNEIGEVNYTEKVELFNFPFGIRGHIPDLKSNIAPFAEVGTSFLWIYRSQANVSFSNTGNPDNEQIILKEKKSNINTRLNRKNLLHDFYVGLGSNFKLKNHKRTRIACNVQYHFSTQDIVKNNKMIFDDDLTYYYYQASPGIKLNYYSFTISFMYLMKYSAKEKQTTLP